VLFCSIIISVLIIKCLHFIKIFKDIISEKEERSSHKNKNLKIDADMYDSDEQEIEEHTNILKKRCTTSGKNNNKKKY
jgi:hypothetical protein